ncbi:YlzJ-like family protein [Herbinix luporum]|jgi:hypothetical protein|uniref:Uncharacterized protein n=1 Tax=Herbinix luporum TaxID=1679721 RepID=A0A0K8J561_9FIRM|nr:YlzJ-like family protein [Herbinix luporum]MDI9488358.1 YlzJ-like family protein [Bacillota bacterium]CUH92478.1 hypothetical protein SD1D_0931 [Herbinix luporum]HHT57079.1 hypothetical protein [Herbinix luporum]
MLYTVVPLERIYLDHRAKDQGKKEEAEPEYKEIQLKHGRVLARREGDNYIVHRITSTDMSDYLNGDYSPGKPVL